MQPWYDSYFCIFYQEVGGRKIKVNVTESFLPNIDRSAPEPEPVFVDSQYKVYVGNLAKTVTTEVLKNFFSEKGQILSATVSHIPGTSKSKGYGFVTFSSEEEVEAAVATFNNAVSFSCIFCSTFLLFFVLVLPHKTVTICQTKAKCCVAIRILLFR